MENFFYNIVSILIGGILVAYGVSLIKSHNRFLGITAFVHSGLFIFFGVFGFFLPKEYGSINILAMLAFTVTMIIFILQFRYKNKKESNNKTLK